MVPILDLPPNQPRRLTRLTLVVRLTRKNRCRGISKDRKSTRLNSSHTVIYTLSLHDALPILDGTYIRLAAKSAQKINPFDLSSTAHTKESLSGHIQRSEEHTSELQSHSDLHSFPTRRSSDLRWYLY